ncbi:MAG: glycosyltransferase [Rubrivivax sp.]|nr:glycosyltransferase [Rubrivivax sp.]
MRIVVVASSFPRPDTASGDLRFATLLSLMAARHQVVFCAVDARGNAKAPDDAAARLVAQGIELCRGSLADLFARFDADVVWFEFYYQARPDYLRVLRHHCLRARVIVDSVDVHYNRLLARAAVSGLPEDMALAMSTKTKELAAYARADLVVAVSNDDRDLLLQELPQAPVRVVPNVHEIPAYPDPQQRRHGELVFVGGFKHDPNVDAVLYFCREVLPLVVAEHPHVRTTIIGSNPPPEVRALEGEHVDVVGYVPETAPYLRRACISIAPLRYGGGMKGKVGEAMSYGLPVVTTTIGAQGFGVVPGRELLVGDSAAAFAGAVVDLLRDGQLRERVARCGYAFISSHYSIPSVQRMLDDCLEQVVRLPPGPAPAAQRLGDSVRRFYRRHVEWRLPKA